MQFDDICAYKRDEYLPVLNKLLLDKEFVSVINKVAPQLSVEAIKATTAKMPTINEFHRYFFKPLIEQLFEKLTEQIVVAGSENITGKPAIYMSNHRDIVTDIIFIAFGMLQSNQVVPQIAIGDNLMAHPWIKEFVRMNGAFLIKRGITPAAQIKAFSQLSSYINNVIESGESIWIAQREGRAKDSNDRTQESLLKMLALGGKNSMIENIEALNICPVSLSYEFDPCDYLKAAELLERSRNEHYKKAENEDVNSMATGIMGYKGRVVCNFTPSINDKLTDEIKALPRKEQAQKVCEIIDSQIHKGYSIFEINCLAHDALYESNFAGDCDVARVGKAFDYLQQRIEMAAKLVEEPDMNFLRRAIYSMYANPLHNSFGSWAEADKATL